MGVEFELNHAPEETEERLSLEQSGKTQWITVQGTWRLFTSGTWRGKIIVEKSADNGASVTRVIARAGEADRNLAENGDGI